MFKYITYGLFYSSVGVLIGMGMLVLLCLVYGV